MIRIPDRLKNYGAQVGQCSYYFGKPTSLFRISNIPIRTKSADESRLFFWSKSVDLESPKRVWIRNLRGQQNCLLRK